MADRVVAIAGASGFVGSAAAQRFAEDGWHVIGLSRRRPAKTLPGVEYLAIDLLDSKSCEEVTERLEEVTHLVYAAVNETPGDLVASWTDPQHAARNGAMFTNLLDPLTASAKGLRHVGVVHGTKAYATHLAKDPPVPMRESLPRPPHDDFYFRQEDALWDRAQKHGFDWTVFRAPTIAGGGRDSNLNGLLAIAIFAVLRADAGLDLPFPGAGDHLGVMEMVDVELLAKAIAWAADAPNARNRTFNVANGDTYIWPDLWPVIASEIGIAAGGQEAMSVRAYIDSNAASWADIVRRNDLDIPEDPADFLGESGSLADFALNNCGRSVLTSTIAIRQAGFHECIDTAESVIKWIRRWRADLLLPPRT